MSSLDNQYRYALLGESVAPTVVHEESDGTMYLGFPLDDCTSFRDAKWLIKRIKVMTCDDGSTYRLITYAGGNRSYTNVWRNRLKLSYPITSNFTDNSDWVNSAEI